MMELLESAYVWYAIAFVVFLAVAWKFGRKPALETLDSRIGAIRNEIEAAENLRIEAQELLAQYERKQRDADKEVDRILELSKEQSDKYLVKAGKDLSDLISGRTRRLEERIELMQSAAVQEIQSRGADIVMDKAVELLSKSITKKSSSELVDISIRRVKSIAA